MTTSLVPSLREIADGTRIPESTRIFFQERIRVRLHQFLLREFVRLMRTTGLTRKDIADRIERRPEQVTRWLGAPSNMTLDTVSDLLLAMGLEPVFDGRPLVAAPAVTKMPAHVASVQSAEAAQGETREVVPAEDMDMRQPRRAAVIRWPWRSLRESRVQPDMRQQATG